MSCETKERVAQNISLKNFLTEEECVSCSKLEIANFQRNFIWKKKNVVALFNSLQEIINEQNATNLYLGSIVIKRTPEGNIGGDLVVDGQQRLVTLSLIIKAIRSKIKKTKECDSLLYSKGATPRIRFSRKNLDEIYRLILSDKRIDTKSLDESQKLFFKNYNLILKLLKNIDNYNNFFNKVKSIEFVVIKCPSIHDVNQLFESLNSNGEKLSPVQLSKNAILSEAKFDDTELDKINNEWEKVESSFEKDKSKIIWFDKFFRHRWFCINGYVLNSQLFDAIKMHIKNVGVEIFTNNLAEDSSIYLSLRKGALGGKEDYSKKISDPQWRKVKLMISHINKMGIDQVYAVLLALVKYGRKEPSYFDEYFFKDIENLWKFFMLMKYSKKFNPNIYEKKFAAFCKDIHNLPDTETFRSVRGLFFRNIFSLIVDEQEFKEVLNDKIRCIDIDIETKDKKVNFNEDRDVIRAFLLLYLTDGERMESADTETIEHIIPKGNINKWSKIKKEYLGSVEKVSRYKLGNLTILEKKLNSSNDVGDEVFDVKFKIAYKKSIYPKNNELNFFEEKFNSDNPELAVIDRGEIIASAIYDNLMKFKK